VPGQYAYANGGQAHRNANLQMESEEARSQLWHGSAADTPGHRNSAAQSGIRSKEFDDTDNQGAIQIKSSHAARELNLGHLIHLSGFVSSLPQSPQPPPQRLPIQAPIERRQHHACQRMPSHIRQQPAFHRAVDGHQQGHRVG
jgi:hypothetical protein